MSRPYAWDLHQSGAADRQGMGWDSASGLWVPQTYLSEVQDEGVALTRRSKLDFQGAGVTATDDAVNGKTVVTIPGGGGGGGSLTVQDENANVATGVTQIDFQGAGVTATAGTGEVVVTIPGGGASALDIDDLTTFNAIYGSTFTSLDQEFSRSGNPTTLPTGWAWVNQGTSTYVEQGGAGIITPQSGAESLRLITQSLSTAPSTWTAVAKIALAWSNSNWHRSAIVLRNASSGNFIQHGLVQSGGWHTNRWASPTSFTAAIGEDTAVNMVSPAYVKVVKNSATSYDFYISTDGLSWVKWIGAHNPSLTIDEIGFLAGAPIADRAASFHWLRIR